eukprot:TRINITY_DN11321_c0_g1_i3.p1 TRINITY_DN11321_c0_g1~~TRINITY_DN11321_c0_g1_i3.p1  ORF type:complete len:641 (-),score=130.77 TRINITY_DN11321_c0_g1_i3:71-1993(-)
MIEYDAGNFGICGLCRIRGSVLPKALCWAEGVGFDLEGVSVVWEGYTVVLLLLLLFRDHQAYSRYWEAASLTHQLRGQWTSCFSILLSSCNFAPEKHQRVKAFQHLLVQLMSMLHCEGILSMSSVDGKNLDTVEASGQMHNDWLVHLNVSPDKCETLAQWIQRAALEAEQNKVLIAGQPIIARAFEELSGGLSTLRQLRKVTDVQFPFCFMQITVCMICFHWLFTPFFVSRMVSSWLWAASLCFAVTFSHWALFYLAQEVERPLGEDYNDLPLRENQALFNKTLQFMLQNESQRVPRFELADSRLSGLEKTKMPAPGQIVDMDEDVYDEADFELQSSMAPTIKMSQNAGVMEKAQVSPETMLNAMSSVDARAREIERGLSLGCGEDTSMLLAATRFGDTSSLPSTSAGDPSSLAGTAGRYGGEEMSLRVFPAGFPEDQELDEERSQTSQPSCWFGYTSSDPVEPLFLYKVLRELVPQVPAEDLTALLLLVGVRDLGLDELRRPTVLEAPSDITPREAELGPRFASYGGSSSSTEMPAAATPDLVHGLRFTSELLDSNSLRLAEGGLRRPLKISLDDLVHRLSMLDVAGAVRDEVAVPVSARGQDQTDRGGGATSEVAVERLERCLELLNSALDSLGYSRL